MDKRVEVLDLPENVREVIAEAEATGRRTVFDRGGQPVSILIAFDEYAALRETIDVANDEALRARLASAEEGVRAGAMLLVEDLIETGSPWNDRLRLAESVRAEWDALSPEERSTARDLLQKIDDDPISGAPLLEPLRGLWTLRAGHLRIAYRVMAEARFVVVLSIARAEPLV